MRNRSTVFVIALYAMLAFFMFRLAQLQLFEHGRLERTASDNAARITPILAPRGIIFDRNGKVLIKNRPVFMLYILPHMLPDDPEPVLSRLASLMRTTPDSIRERLKVSRRPIFEGILIAQDVPLDVASKIEESREGLPGVEIICYPLRSYPYRGTASHVLGYVAEIESAELAALRDKGYRLGDLIGKDGVEKSYDRHLRGVSGGRKLEVDAYGKPLRVIEVIDPVPGNNIVLTIDIELQQKVEELLRGKEGAVVVLDPNSGEVLAMASHPYYDASKRWEEIDQRNHPFMNRALATYPPGSIFKVVTLAAALQEGKTEPQEMTSCHGSYRLGQRTAKCWLSSGHGRLSAIEGLVWSCNVVFYELGKRLGPDLIQKYSDRFGLGKPTGIDLPQEKRGFIPTSGWKRRRFNEPWYDGDSINLGIGQAYTQVTPLQMAALYGQIAVGTRKRPFVVKKVVDKSGEVVFENKTEDAGSAPLSFENLKLMRESLREVILRATGVAAYVSGYEGAGKTGTAQNPGAPHAWFVCYAPHTTPEVVISAFVAHGGHGDRVTASIAREVLKWYKENRSGPRMEERARPAQYILHGDRRIPYRTRTETETD